MASLNLSSASFFRRAKTANIHARVQNPAAETTEGSRRRGRDVAREETHRSVEPRSSPGPEARRLLTLADDALLTEPRGPAQPLHSPTDDGGLQANGDGRLQSAEQPKREYTRFKH